MASGKINQKEPPIFVRKNYTKTFSMSTDKTNLAIKTSDLGYSQITYMGATYTPIGITYMYTGHHYVHLCGFNVNNLETSTSTVASLYNCTAASSKTFSITVLFVRSDLVEWGDE